MRKAPFGLERFIAYTAEVFLHEDDDFSFITSDFTVKTNGDLTMKRSDSDSLMSGYSFDTMYTYDQESLDIESFEPASKTSSKQRRKPENRILKNAHKHRRSTSTFSFFSSKQQCKSKKSILNNNGKHKWSSSDVKKTNKVPSPLPETNTNWLFFPTEQSKVSPSQKKIAKEKILSEQMYPTQVAKISLNQTQTTKKHIDQKQSRKRNVIKQKETKKTKKSVSQKPLDKKKVKFATLPDAVEPSKRDIVVKEKKHSRKSSSNSKTQTAKKADLAEKQNPTTNKKHSRKWSHDLEMELPSTTRPSKSPVLVKQEDQESKHTRILSFDFLSSKKENETAQKETSSKKAAKKIEIEDKTDHSRKLSFDLALLGKVGKGHVPKAKSEDAKEERQDSSDPIASLEQYKADSWSAWLFSGPEKLPTSTVFKPKEEEEEKVTVTPFKNRADQKTKKKHTRKLSLTLFSREKSEPESEPTPSVKEEPQEGPLEGSLDVAAWSWSPFIYSNDHSKLQFDTSYMWSPSDWLGHKAPKDGVNSSEKGKNSSNKKASNERKDSSVPRTHRKKTNTKGYPRYPRFVSMSGITESRDDDVVPSIKLLRKPKSTIFTKEKASPAPTSSSHSKKKLSGPTVCKSDTKKGTLAKKNVRNEVDINILSFASRRGQGQEMLLMSNDENPRQFAKTMLKIA
jgi:hypothetical protein